MFSPMRIERSLVSYLNCIRRLHFSNHDTIRNIGILAHIDAGKTTTTERMLFYSGKTDSLGEVHRGNTITDCMKQERERGITICSSAVSFDWNAHRINLLDTPGHIDFTMEVEQSLAAVDGVIIVLDGSSGVEAQTMTVWSQADRQALPKIVFVNKMDREDADYSACLQDMREKLNILPIALQWPLKTGKELTGLIDIISKKGIQWKKNNSGKEYEILNLPLDVVDYVCEQRKILIDTLCDINDSLAETLISEGDHSNISDEMIRLAVRNATCSRKAIPVLLGSAYKNIGVQPLLDSVCAYLPSPRSRSNVYDCFGDNFAGKVFKILHDNQRGPLSLVRVFRGSLKKGMRITTVRGTSEVLQRIYKPLADNYKEVDSVECGDIGVCAGLKNTITGDLLTSSMTAIRIAEKNINKLLDSVVDDKNKVENLEMLKEGFLVEPNIPDAVYFCSIEPPSLAYQNELEKALSQLQREDPSLRVNHDEITGQTVLGGMGELHMEIVKSRLKSEYKINAELGPLQIAYKESIDADCSGTWRLEKDIAGSKQNVLISLSLTKNSKEPFRLDTSPDNMAKLKLVHPRAIQVIKKGALAGLERGPRVGGKVVDTQIKLEAVTIGRGTADSFLMSAASQCVQKILSERGTRLLEPVMAVQIVAPSLIVASIIADLGKRRATINSVNAKGERNKLIETLVPLSELTGYSSMLRTISSGSAIMTMQPWGYAAMSSQEEHRAERRSQGLE